MKFGTLSINDAVGAILAHSVTTSGRTWRKATPLSQDDVDAMRAAGVTSVIAARLADDDAGEDEAATEIAAGFVSPGIEARPAATGRVNLHATASGVFVVDKAAVDAINAVDPALTMATLPDYATVEPGRMVATVKVIPFGVRRDLVERAAAVGRRGGVLRLHPFRPMQARLIQTELPSLKASVLDKTARLTRERLARSGSTMKAEARCAHDEASLASLLGGEAKSCDLVIVFGASAVSDSDDVIPAAIRRAGGTVERVGMPVDPGNLLVIGHIGPTCVIGAPGCARSPKPNGFDWVLDRLAAGLPAGDAVIAGMGVGGLLMEIESRPRPREQPLPSAGAVHAVLLAAGQGKRMGGPNKLLATFDGVPLVRRSAAMLVESAVASTVAVLGHQAGAVRGALAGLPLRIVDNPDFADGLAGSLRAGIAALPREASGVLVALADMPNIRPADIDRLVAAFRRESGSAIVRATHAGKRGNPVILPRALFPAVRSLDGDTGARHLVETSGLPVIDVELGEAASLDVDTPEAMALAGGRLAG